MKNRFLFFVFILIVTSCYYKDGPVLSFVSKTNRITGEYHIESVTVNGIDQMAGIDTLHIDHFRLDSNTISGGDGLIWVVFTDTTMHESWALAPGNKQIDFPSFGCYSGPGGPISFQPLPGFLGDCDHETLWDILKLTNKCIWVKINYNNNDYEVHLKK